MDDRDPRTLRLFDLAPHEAVVVVRQCGWIAEYGDGPLQRQHRVPSDTLLYDLQYGFHCKHCNRRTGFKIALQDRRHMGTSSHLPEPRVIVEPGKDQMRALALGKR